ncbi:MAG: hypothetical protein H6737_21275 [Alphaproteobacteria bacterium]|nr:hypothetical protein [Alphaproteobacteria bacterium]
MWRSMLVAAALVCAPPAFAGSGKSALKTARVYQERWEVESEESHLTKAAESFAQAVADPGVASSAGTWLVGGEIASSIASAHWRAVKDGRVADLPPLEAGALAAADAYEKALSLQPKKTEIGAAHAGLRNAIGVLLQEATQLYDAQRYDAAITRYDRILAVHQALKEAGQESPLDEDGGVVSIRLAIGLTAWAGGESDRARAIFTELEAAGVDRPAVYEALYQSTLETDPDAARAWLQKGRERHPDEVGLLFAEINDLLKRGEHTVLLERIDDALAKEPANTQLYLVLGTVHQELADASRAKGDADGAATHLAEADAALKKGLEHDPGSVPLHIELGALHFNAAARVGAALLEVDDPVRYEAMRETLVSEMRAALPYFQEAEKRDPNDVTTLNALKDIYAHLEDFPMSKEFGGRLLEVLNGGSNTSYFAK